MLLFLGRGHTSGDVVAYLPKQRVVATGDLLHGWMPFMGDSYPPEWVATLDALDKLEFDHIIGGHGTVKPKAHLRFFRNYLADLDRRSAARARERGETLDQATQLGRRRAEAEVRSRAWTDGSPDRSAPTSRRSTAISRPSGTDRTLVVGSGAAKGRALLPDATYVGRGLQPRHLLRLRARADGVEVLRRADEHLAVGRARPMPSVYSSSGFSASTSNAGPALNTDRQAVLVRDVDPSLGQDRRRAVGARLQPLRAVDDRAGLHVETVDDAAVVDDVDVACRRRPASARRAPCRTTTAGACRSRRRGRRRAGPAAA